MIMGILCFQQHLILQFQTKDLSPLKYFLGIEVSQSASSIILSQSKYAFYIFEETRLIDCKLWYDYSYRSQCQAKPRSGGMERTQENIGT